MLTITNYNQTTRIANTTKSTPTNGRGWEIDNKIQQLRTKHKTQCKDMDQNKIFQFIRCLKQYVEFMKDLNQNYLLCFEPKTLKKNHT